VYLISVKRHFDAAHFIKGYHGKCEKTHGHRYEVAAYVETEKQDNTGIAFDFTELKICLDEITNRYDHNCLNEVPPFDRINPTAENIARNIYEQLKPTVKGAKLDAIEVWESPDSSVKYKP